MPRSGIVLGLERSPGLAILARRRLPLTSWARPSSRASRGARS